MRISTLRESDAFLLKCALLATLIFAALTFIQFSNEKTVSIATEGGTFSEGVVGTPRFVNPVLAVTRADKDLAALIYDGLLTLGSDGVLINNIAESVTISEDGLTYNVILKRNVSFHDGVELTARDVAFTVGRIQDPLLTSPLRASFDGISVEEIGTHELNFVLPEAYSPFIENLTFGILPQHIWKDAGIEELPFSQYNSEPIGAGPYMIEKIIRNTSGIPEIYVLKANESYHVRAPKINYFEMHFFPTEEKLLEAFKKGVVRSVVGVDPKRIPEYELNEKLHHLERIPLPRTFAVFMNQNKSAALRNTAVREALNISIDRKALIEVSLGGYGNALVGPVPSGFGIATESSTSTMQNIERARDILRDGGWAPNPETQILEKKIDDVLTPLSFNLATVNNSSFEATAEFLRKTWKELGAEVSVKQFEQSDLTQVVIRPRDYQALLFGTQLGRALDYYSFWHSSQRNDPGLNVALYANILTDSILSDLRTNSNSEARSEKITAFAEELSKEIPAIFLYAPELLYIFPNSVHGASFGGTSEPQERFTRVYDWYIETESVWSVFTEKQG